MSPPPRSVLSPFRHTTINTSIRFHTAIKATCRHQATSRSNAPVDFMGSQNSLASATFCAAYHIHIIKEHRNTLGPPCVRVTIYGKSLKLEKTRESTGTGDCETAFCGPCEDYNGPQMDPGYITHHDLHYCGTALRHMYPFTPSFTLIAA